ncbi:FtsB family cell division protein [Corynebacterium ulceribovis]|uniref:FtsB family cell division protein n=1 Tax=Corynebacterium ulceribovis TaxID=487732 RepID=UPI00036514B2|nr:septum formation initiator family protein [Corynebacterium ulceribovis]
MTSSTGTKNTIGRKQATMQNTLTPVRIVTLLLLMVFLLAVLAMPLRSYMQQKSEAATVEAENARLEIQRDQLRGELEKYTDEAYIKEQARIRLGLTEPGETPFRILDPRMEGQANNAEPEAAPEAEQAWYEVLWEALSVAPDVTVDNPDGEPEAPPEDSLPYVPGSGDPGKQEPEDQPAAPGDQPPAVG